MKAGEGVMVRALASEGAGGTEDQLCARPFIETLKDLSDTVRLIFPPHFIDEETES